jgi:hypothetical protein
VANSLHFSWLKNKKNKKSEVWSPMDVTPTLYHFYDEKEIVGGSVAVVYATFL